MLLFIGALSAGMAAVVAGCGGEPRKDEFVGQADAVCIDHAERMLEVADKYGLAPTGANGVDSQYFQPEVIEINSDALRDLADIRVPDDLEARYRDLLEHRRQVVEIGNQANSATDAGFTKAEHAFFDIYGRDKRIALDLGLFACANRLRLKDRVGLKAAIEGIWTTPKPSDCTENFTKELVNLWIGGLNACERRRRGIAPAASVEVDKLRGIAGVSARARVRPRGGTHDGRLVRQEYRYEDGRWKLDFSTGGLKVPDL